MAFNAEAVAKLRLDTTDFQRGLTSTIAQTAQAGDDINRKLKRSFGAGDAFKGLLQGIGIGSVGAIGDAIVAPFQHAAERAKAALSVTEELTANTFKWLAALGGPTAEFAMQVKEVNDLNRSIGEQRALIASMQSNPLNLFGNGLEQVKEAESKLDELIKKQDSIATMTKIAVLMENRRADAVARQIRNASELAAIELRHGTDGMAYAAKKLQLEKEYEILRKDGALPSTLLQNQKEQRDLEAAHKIAMRNNREKIEETKRAMQLDQEQTKIELRDGSQREKLQAKLNALLRERKAIVAQGGAGSPKDFENLRQTEAMKGQIEVLAKTMGDELKKALESLGEGLGNSQPSKRPQPRPRGRSEAERLADRGLTYKDQAEEGIKTGRSPKYVADLASQARRDLGLAGEKAAMGASMVKPEDAKALNSQLIGANEHLKAIRENLDVVGGKQ